MDDRFLHQMHREPRPEFTRALRERLHRIEDEEEERAPAFRISPVLAGIGAVAAIALLFTLPSVRASAQALLDLFRVRQFAVVQFDPARMDKLKALRDQNSTLLLADEDPALRDTTSQTFATPEAAGAAAGFDVKKPAFLPNGLALQKVELFRAAEGRVTFHADKLRALLDQLGLTDVQVPPGFDGYPITVRKPPLLAQEYANGRWRAMLLQARSPEVGLPPGADLAKLGEVGLRILGLDAAEARRVAGSIDWHSTLVVPVPLNATTFRPVTINGHDGVLVTLTGEAEVHGRRLREGSLVLWTEGDRVLALRTTLGGQDASVMAESVR